VAVSCDFFVVISNLGCMLNLTTLLGVGYFVHFAFDFDWLISFGPMIIGRGSMILLGCTRLS
jgi:hypothetical protein